MQCSSSPRAWRENRPFLFPVSEDCTTSNRRFTRLSATRACPLHPLSSRAVTILTIQFFHTGTTWLYHHLANHKGFGAVKESYLSPELMRSDQERKQTYDLLFKRGLCSCASNGYLDQVHGGRDKERSNCLYEKSAVSCPTGVSTGLMGRFLPAETNASYVFGSLSNLVVLVHVRSNHLRHALRARSPEEIVKTAIAYERMTKEHMEWGMKITANLPKSVLLLSTYEDMKRNASMVMHNLWSLLGVNPSLRRNNPYIPSRNKPRLVKGSLVDAINKHGGVRSPCLREMVLSP